MHRIFTFFFIFTGLLWKIFSGVKKSTKQSAAVFVLEKRSLDAKYPGAEHKNERERLLEQIRKSISQLTRLRHPQVLTVQFPLEESRDCLAFATGIEIILFCVLHFLFQRCSYVLLRVSFHTIE